MDAAVASLLAALHPSANHRNLCSRFSSYLQPFSDLIAVASADAVNRHNHKPPPKKKNSPSSAAAVRPLAKQFLAFICKALNLLPPLFQESSNGDRVEERDSDELLGVYALVLDCLGCLMPVLEGEPYMFHLHRGVFLRCLVTAGKYERAETEADVLLQDLISALVPAGKVSRSKKGKGVAAAGSQVSFPDPELVGGDHSRITALVIDIITSMCNCAFNSKSKRSEVYERVMALVQQVRPWIGLSDQEASKRNRLRFLRPLYACAAFLTSECRSFGPDLVSRFCVTMLEECASCSFNQLTVSATKICSRIDLNWVNGPSVFLDVLGVTLQLSLRECKDQFGNGAKEFLDFISSASDILYDAEPNISKLAFNNLKDHAEKFDERCPPVGLVLSLYSTALYFKSTVSFSQTDQNNPISPYATILACQEELSRLIASIETLSSYFSAEQKRGDRNGSHLFGKYLDALGFLCQVLLPCAKSGWTQFCSGGKHFPDSPNWSNISKVLQVFCSCVIDDFSAITKNDEVDKEKTDRKRKLLLESLISWFRLCFFFAIPYKKCCDLISVVLSSEWISPTEVKYFVSSLSNTAQSLYQIRSRVTQAPLRVALDMYCKAVLENLRRICHNHLAKSNDISHDRLKNIKETVSDVYKRVGSIIFLFHDCHPQDIASINDITVCTLFEIALVDNLYWIQSNSFPLVKEWVKVLCKEYNDGDKKYDVPFLYYSLKKKLDPKKYSMSLGRILEKELLAYQLLESRYPDICKIMQEKIIKVLLEELYSKKYYFLERSRVLIAKARVLRARGIDGLRSCLDLLSEAISLLRDAKSDSYEGQALANHQLATACCLHALCAQENKLDFEVIIEDINSALDSWLEIDIEHYTWDDDLGPVATKMVPLLCSLIDLLSIKGYYKHHSRICELMAKIFKREGIPVQKLFALLFSDRRLGHSNCGLQMDVELISNALHKCDAGAHLTEFWANCLGFHKPSLCMFAQSLLVNCLVLPEVNEKELERSLQCKLGTTEIEQIASSLISDPKLASRSFFIASYLYHDLSQRLLSEGKLIEALSYAKEAFNLRTKLLHRKFMYSHKKPYDIRIGTRDSVATETWPDSIRADTIIDSFLSPWIILRCYLESIFQVGSIYESIGNGAEAEFMFRTGKEMSHLQLLDSFEITFVSSLGQLYRKWQLWDMADSELRFAKKLLLLSSKSTFSCENCKKFLETTVNLQLGDLIHSRFKNNSQDRSENKNTLEDALCIYQSALDDLDNSDEFEFIKMEKAETIDPLNSKCKLCLFLKQTAQPSFVNNKKASRNCKGVLKENNLDAKKITRTTTRARSCKTSIVTETEEEFSTEFNASKKFQKKPNSKCHGVCWACLINRALNSGDLINMLYLGVEFRRNSFRLSLRLKIARTLGAQSEISDVHEIHNLYWKSILLLFSRVNSSEVPLHHQLMELLVDEEWKTLSIDRAMILYNMSFFLLKNLLSDQHRDPCCTLANFQMRDVVTWLLKAFVFSREFPFLLQKVSRLLASALILSTTDHSVPMPLYLNKSLSIYQWASYFHQVSISTSLDTFHQSLMKKIPSQVKSGAVYRAYSDNIKFLRFSFENIRQLEEHIKCFFKNLPDVPIICISMIDGDYASLLKAKMIISSCHAWVMLTKFDSMNQPLTMVLPAVEISEGNTLTAQCDLSTGKNINNMQPAKEWQCPWSYTVLDHVVPSFKLLMKENILSTNETIRQKYWEWRVDINNRLGFLLRNIDESWFGTWSCLLRGNLTNNNKNKESLVAAMVNNLKSVTNLEVNPSLVKGILEGSESLEDAKECISQLILYGGYFGHGGFCGKDGIRAFSTSCDLGSEIPKNVIKVLEDAFSGPISVNREPVIFVLDTYVQMLPWESLPSLRRQEVYRMPSVGSILLTLDINYQRHKEKEREFLLGNYFPKVDPYDTYYLLNPSGDLKDTEEDLKPWLEGLNFKGKTRVAQTSEELGAVLRDHEMFFYFGHGSGTQYISRHEIEKLEIRAAALLMGCSSGVLTCKGNYVPQGAPLSYLFAGSPAVISNLWDVTDRDIDKFSKAVVNSWLEDQVKSLLAVDCSACALLEIPKRGKGKKMVLSGGGDNNKKWCMECMTRRIASSIFKARDVCRLNMLTGAAPVCYGVPTVLKRKD